MCCLTNTRGMITNHSALVSIPSAVSAEETTSSTKSLHYSSAKNTSLTTVTTSSQKHGHNEPSFTYALSVIKAQGGRKRSSSESATSSLERSIKDRDLLIASQRSHIVQSLSPSSSIQSMPQVAKYKSPQTSPKMLHVGALQMSNLAVQSFQQSNPVIIAAANQSLPYTVTSLSSTSKPSAQPGKPVQHISSIQAVGGEPQQIAVAGHNNLVVSKVDISTIQQGHVLPEFSGEMKTKVVICSSRDSTF